MIEIYNEMVRDLLGKKPTAELYIREGEDGPFVDGLTNKKVNNIDELNKVGNKVNFAVALFSRARGSKLNEVRVCKLNERQYMSGLRQTVVRVQLFSYVYCSYCLVRSRVQETLASEGMHI